MLPGVGDDRLRIHPQLLAGKAGFMQMLYSVHWPCNHVPGVGKGTGYASKTGNFTPVYNPNPLIQSRSQSLDSYNEQTMKAIYNAIQACTLPTTSG